MKHDIDEKEAIFLVYCQLAFLSWIAKLFGCHTCKADADKHCEYVGGMTFPWKDVVAFVIPPVLGVIFVLYSSHLLSTLPDAGPVPKSEVGPVILASK